MSISMYLKIPNITGGSRDAGHAGSLAILAWSWGLSSSGSALGGPGKPNVQDVSLTATQDTATSPLMLALMKGSQFDTATLTVVYSGQALPVDKYVFSNVLITSVSTGGSGGEDRFTVNYTLSFSALDATISRAEWHWDLATGNGG